VSRPENFFEIQNEVEAGIYQQSLV